MLRYLIQSILNNRWSHIPAGTFLANSIGCFIAGLAIPLLPTLHPHLRTAFIAGFLGSLTTLSALHLEIFQAFDKGKITHAIFHWAGGAVIGLILCILGNTITQMIKSLNS